MRHEIHRRVRVCSIIIFFFKSRSRHTSLKGDGIPEVCSPDLCNPDGGGNGHATGHEHAGGDRHPVLAQQVADRKSTRLNSSHLVISYAVFCLKKKKKISQYI